MSRFQKLKHRVPITDIFSLQANFKMFLFLSSRNFLSYFSTLCNFKCLQILNYNYFYINPYVIWVFTNDKKVGGPHFVHTWSLYYSHRSFFWYIKVSSASNLDNSISAFLALLYIPTNFWYSWVWFFQERNPAPRIARETCI